MKSLIRLSVLTALATLASMSTGRAAEAQALPSSADVIAKYVAAIGGKDAIMQIKSMSSTGTLEIPAMGLSANMEMNMAAPNKMAVKTNIPGMGDLQSGSNGTVAWDINPMAGERLLADKELEQSVEAADFYGNLLYTADRYTTIEVLAEQDFGGEKAYKLKFVRKGSGTVSTQFFSVASGLLLGGETSQVAQGGTMAVSQVLSGYKQFGAIKMPTRIEQSIGPNKLVLTTTTVTINQVPDSAFDVPAKVKALIKP